MVAKDCIYVLIMILKLHHIFINIHSGINNNLLALLGVKHTGRLTTLKKKLAKNLLALLTIAIFAISTFAIVNRCRLRSP